MAYHLEGRLLEVCNCRVLCPCWIGEDPDYGTCDTIVAWHFDKGTIDGVDVVGPHDRDDRARARQHPAGQLEGGGLPRRARIAGAGGGAARRVHRQAGRSGRRAREAGRRGRVGREGADHVRRAGRQAARSSSATPAMPSSSRTRARRGATTTLDRHGVLDGPGRAGVRRQVADVPGEECRSSASTSTSRATTRCRARSCSTLLTRDVRGAVPRCRATLPRARPAARASGSRAARSSRCSAALLVALSALAWARAVAVEREPVRRATSTTAAGATRARSPRCAARSRQATIVVPALLHALRLGADDRGDDAADDAIRCSALFRRIVARRGRTRGTAGRRWSSPASSSRGSRSASLAHARTRRCVGARRALAVAGACTAGSSAPRCSRAPALFQFSALKYRCLEQCRTPFALRRVALARPRAARARRCGSASTTACSASAAAGR